MDRRDLLKWVTPVILVFGPKYAEGKKADSPTPGDSVIRYGSDCGVRQNYGQCKPRNNQSCEPVRFGNECYPKESDLESNSR
ncbi:MAG: hypothetical protein Q7S33_04335 [Nanoarchaeota archaeon]|nr:hypothetical protein [Nanoarchaeota archaeon]